MAYVVQKRALRVVSIGKIRVMNEMACIMQERGLSVEWCRQPWRVEEYMKPEGGC